MIGPQRRTQDANPVGLAQAARALLMGVEMASTTFLGRKAILNQEIVYGSHRLRMDL